MDRTQILLKAISLDEYQELRKINDLECFIARSHDLGFAEIINPLKYDNYSSAFIEAKNDYRIKGIIIYPKDSGKTIRLKGRSKLEELGCHDIEELLNSINIQRIELEGANERNASSFSFQKRAIGVITTRLYIPRPRLDDFSWDGAHKQYHAYFAMTREKPLDILI